MLAGIGLMTHTLAKQQEYLILSLECSLHRMIQDLHGAIFLSSENGIQVRLKEQLMNKR